MEESGTIRLPTNLGIAVAQELKARHGIDKWKDGPLLNLNFSKEELAKIISLKFKNPSKGDLAGIENLPNLRRLHIEGDNVGRYIHPKNRVSIGFEDVLCIEKCKNLEVLSIIKQPDVTDIDLGKLPKLEDVDIRDNMNLSSIDGIDKLSNLSSLTCYGNQSLEEFKGLDKAIIKNKDNLDNLNLDVLLFPKAIGFTPFSGVYNQEALSALEQINALEAGLNQVKWSESVSGVAKTEICHANMLNMHNRACQILNDVCPRNCSVPDTVVAVERYLAENVTYDWDALEHGRRKGMDLETNGQKMRINTGPENGTNGSYNCLMENSCVCEGYTRGEQYLLGLKGIKTRNVSCIMSEDHWGMSDSTKEGDELNTYVFPKGSYHSIICISDYYNLYSDPCWNASSYRKGDKSLPYSLLTKEEIIKSGHALSFEERGVTGNQQAPSRREVVESIRRNSLFRNTKASEARMQRAGVQPKVIGMVRGLDGRTH